MSTIFVAIDDDTGEVLSGASGQYAYGNVSRLRKSMGQELSYAAKLDGVRPKDLYSVHEIDIVKAIAVESEIDELHKLYSTEVDEIEEKIDENFDIHGTSDGNFNDSYEMGYTHGEAFGKHQLLGYLKGGK